MAGAQDVESSIAMHVTGFCADIVRKAELLTRMPTWIKGVFRTIGALDAVLSILGLYLFLDPISRGMLALIASRDTPYFKIAFGTMIVANGVVLFLFVLAAVQLLRLKKLGATVHITASGLLVAYDLLIRIFWTAGGSVGMSVAAATGIGNLGIAPFQCFNLAPYAYPIASTMLLLVTRRKMVPAPQTSRAIFQ
jgi:hypothetical protein